jgi:hypothetical protein
VIDSNRPTRSQVRPKSFWPAMVVGAAVATYGVVGMLDAFPDFARRASFAKWVIGAALIHDLVLVPVVAVIGLATARLVPHRWRQPVRFALMGTGITLLIAFHPLRGSAAGRVDNPSIQPLSYGTAVATVLGVVWLIAAVWALLSARRAGPDGTGVTPG